MNSKDIWKDCLVLIFHHRVQCPIFQTLQRKLKNSSFFAVQGTKSHGCQFINEAFTKGGAFVVTDKMPVNINSENIFCCLT